MNSDRAMKPFKVDRLSNLPEGIFHHILSLLDIIDLARLCKSSKRCRKLCLSSPFLNINEDLQDVDDFHEFAESVDRFISLHNGPAIRQFHLSLDCPELEYNVVFRIGTWLLHLTKLKVEDVSLDINMDPEQGFSLPSQVLDCTSLLSLKLNLHQSVLDFSIRPSSSLQILSLKDFQIEPTNLFGEWITRTFMLLKKLHLENFYGIKKLNLDSSSLEDLTIKRQGKAEDLVYIKVSAERLEHLYIEWYFEDFEDNSLEILAPRLKDFHWSGDIPSFSYQGNFGCLHHASILLEPSFSLEDEEYRAFVNRTMYKILQIIRQVSSLCFWDIFAEMIHVHLPQNLDNLQTLTLLMKGRDLFVPEIASFLNLALHLRALNLDFRSFQNFLFPTRSSFCHEFTIDESLMADMGSLHWKELIPPKNYDSVYWETQNLKFVDSLEEVKAHLESRVYDTELIKYLLENGKSLRKMTILYDPLSLRQPFLVSRKFQQCKKASSSAEIYFLPEKWSPCHCGCIRCLC